MFRDMEAGDVAIAERPARVTQDKKRGVLLATIAGVVLLAVVPAYFVALNGGPEAYESVHLSFPGSSVAVGTAVFWSLGLLSGLATLGIAVGLVLFLKAPRKSLFLPDTLSLRTLRWASGTWAITSAVLVFVKGPDAVGLPFSELMEPGGFRFVFIGSYYPTAFSITAVFALLCWFATWFVQKWTDLLIPLWLIIFGNIIPVAVGQLLVGPGHDFGSDAGYLRVLASGVVASSIGVFSYVAVRPSQAKNFNLECAANFGLIGVVALLAIEIVITAFQLAGTDLTASTTGWLILVRWLIELLLLLLAVLARKRVRSGRSMTPVVTVVSVTVLAGWAGMLSAIAQVPPPHYFEGSGTMSEVFLGYELPEGPDLAGLFLEWRIDVFFIALFLAAVVGYVALVRRLRRKGQSWPGLRTFAWMLGWATVLLSTSSGWGRFAGGDFGIHMVTHMSLNMLAPLLLVLSGPITLALNAWSGASGTAGWARRRLVELLNWRAARWLSNPLFVFVVYIASYYVLYLTPMFEFFMNYHWGHQLMNLHFLMIGYLYFSLIIGVDKGPVELPYIGKLGLAFAAMPFHAFFGVILMMTAEPIAQQYYLYLDYHWSDLVASQELGGGVAWAGGEIPILIVIIALAAQWSRQDQRERTRVDRHMDQGYNTEFDDYNRMLIELAADDQQAATERRE